MRFIKKYNALLTLTVFLFSFSVLSFLQLRATSVVAESASAAVTVAAVCTMTADVEEAHTDSIPPHTYRADIGTTTFNVLCNDSAGFSIYAIGYSNDEYGNNKLLATIGGTLNPTYDIITGTGTNAATTNNTSNWAMKINKVTGTYAPTITGETQGDTEDFTDYHTVPDTYTKVATLTSNTDATIGSKLQSTYAAYISGTQPAGTYNGKVKYTLVHPNDEVPLQPLSCAASKICYYPNAHNSEGVMGTLQTIESGTTEYTLWPSNFSREGYGFAGWSDKYNWAVNENDEDGNGTGVNEGYHIYGPMATIALDPEDYASPNNGLSLYAVWAKAETGVTMQTFNPTAFPYNTKAIGTVIALKDERDDNTYAVAKLADGKWWMIENLRLGNTNSDNATGNLAQGYGGVFVGLANSESPWSPESTSENSLYSTKTTSTTKNIITGSDQAYRFPRYNKSNTANRIASLNYYNTSSNIYSYGNYYTWAAAMANTNDYVVRLTNTEAYDVDGKTPETVGTSICPKGWQLPYGRRTGNGATAGGFYNLNYKVNNDVNATDANASKLLRQYPNNFLYSGIIYYSGEIALRGINGYYWSSAVYEVRDSEAAYTLNVNSSVAWPGVNGTQRAKSNGLSVRCVASN